MTALDILKQKLFEHYRPSFTSDERTWEVVNLGLVTETTEPVLAAMREIYTTGFNNGYKKSYDDHVDGFGYEPDLEQKLKELFPEK